MTDPQIFPLGDVVLQSGTTLWQAKLAYTTYGTLNPARDNARGRADAERQPSADPVHLGPRRRPRHQPGGQSVHRRRLAGVAVMTPTTATDLEQLRDLNQAYLDAVRTGDVERFRQLL